MTAERENPRLPTPAPAAVGRRSGNGAKAWATRRANTFLSAIAGVLRGRRPATDAELAQFANAINDYLVRFTAAGTALPRGYTVLANRLQELSLSYNGSVLCASFLDDLPAREVLQQLVSDIATGWLDEVCQALGDSEPSRLWREVRGGLCH